MTLRSLLVLLLPLLLILGFGPAPAAAVAMKKRTVTFFQDPPVINTIIDGNLTVYQYYADLRTAKGGPLVGRLYGQTNFNEALFANAVRACVRVSYMCGDVCVCGQAGT